MSRDDAESMKRRWDLVDAEKLRARAERFFREGPEGCARASEELRKQAHALGAVSDRAADLRRHIAWRLLLDKADERVAGRR